MIVLFTDFGLAGPYVGQVQAVLQQQAPGIPVINLFSDLTPFDIQGAACLLPAYAAGFPRATVFVCVVDPGVGGARPGVVVQADGRWYVGPNEGLFALLVRQSRQVECWQLAASDGVSASFHGRDVFAPVAARLARGGKVPGASVAVSCLAQPDWPDDLFRVVYIDRFGNAMTGVRAGAVAEGVRLAVNGRPVQWARTFSDVSPGEAFWYENANGLVEFAVNRGRADEVLGLTAGTVFK
ncbi:MAG: SAM-dependent chlorinase/fluorinase [Gammaproteobacteria bacterium]|nr:SAM-dependent chlorinase/fluorinase [Gammaproteobacteria bacterium]